MSLSSIQLAQLRKIAATHENNPNLPDVSRFALVKASQVSALVKGAFIQINASVAANAEGLVPARATEAGVALLGQVASGTATPKTKPTFALVANVAIPETVRGNHGGGRSLYPFDSMEVGQSFFVPAEASETAAETAKKLASSVSSANKRFVTSSIPLVDGSGQPVIKRGKAASQHTYSKYFVLRPIEDGASFGHTGKSGAAVWRNS